MWVSVGQKTAWKICKYLPFVGRCFYPAGAAAAATVRAALTATTQPFPSGHKQLSRTTKTRGRIQRQLKQSLIYQYNFSAKRQGRGKKVAVTCFGFIIHKITIVDMDTFTSSIISTIQFIPRLLLYVWCLTCCNMKHVICVN